jgi:ABC-type lipoprotein export system ATPase subunit
VQIGSDLRKKYCSNPEFWAIVVRKHGVFVQALNILVQRTKFFKNEKKFAFMILLLNVRKVFNARKPNEFSAIQGINLKIVPQSVTVFMGPGGSGKTTLFSLIGCMAGPTAHLDTTLSLELVNILGRLKEDGKTVLIASHTPLVCGSKIVDHVIKCLDGKIDGQYP